MPPRKYNLVGQRFTKLTVIAEAEDSRSSRRWHCQCDCGTKVTFSQISLLNGKAYSCGCISVLRLRGEAKKAHPKEYRVWMAMVERCTNPNNKRWADYGGRGIKVCERWRNFANFIADMGPRPNDEHQIDRINNDGDYEPGNCQWATRSQQIQNRHNTILLTIGGVTKSLTDWVCERKLNYFLVRQRIVRDGMSPEKALGFDGDPMPTFTR